jgi:hypothetical protein
MTMAITLSITFLVKIKDRLDTLGFCQFIGDDWYADIDNNGEYQRIGDIFSQGMGTTGFTNWLCYNKDCFRISHVVNEADEEFARTRQICCGPINGLCVCPPPRCLLPGPHWLPELENLPNFYEAHASIRFELDLNDLESATQNPLLFRQLGISAAVVRCADETGLSNFGKNALHCIEEHPRESFPNWERQQIDRENFFSREDPEFGGNLEYKIPKRLYCLGF